jgi:hypothetical protein
MTKEIILETRNGCIKLTQIYGRCERAENIQTGWNNFHRAQKKYGRGVAFSAFQDSFTFA